MLSSKVKAKWHPKGRARNFKRNNSTMCQLLDKVWVRTSSSACANTEANRAQIVLHTLHVLDNGGGHPVASFSHDEITYHTPKEVYVILRFD
jgi:hypothetical protein